MVEIQSINDRPTWLVRISVLISLSKLLKLIVFIFLASRSYKRASSPQMTFWELSDENINVLFGLTALIFALIGAEIITKMRVFNGNWYRIFIKFLIIYLSWIMITTTAWIAGRLLAYINKW